ncbi:sulfatase [Dyadobacter sp. LJ53]|uniref:sulfatase family protein n=1 Tax=Dyadobacter chenwenxiniae TaxID=2906456 RepID=UPI001F277C60|nr:sulfatase [Dyadobacter chenwenxiniae]MCF0049166.1 sulfatase [Dyadobacter chenwenxiniae]
MRRYTWIVLLSLPVFAAIQINKNETKAAETRPNILFCIADDASYRHMSAYGLSGKWISTPGFDRVAAGGILFENAFTPNAKCSPSRACILTGRNPWQLEEAANHVPFFPAKFSTWVEELGNSGYLTGFTGKGWAPGNPGQKNGATRLLTGKHYNEKKMAAPTKAISPVNYAANLEVFLKDRKAGQPFCFWYGGHEPHRAYEYGSGAAKGKKKITDIDRVPAYWPDNDTVRNDMLDYAYEIEYFDQHLQQMLKILEDAGELNNTIVIVTSDNGMPFPRTKGHVYDYDNHLPLAIMWKNGIKTAGRKVLDLVSFIDFAPTLLEAAGLTGKTSVETQGRSLIPIFKSDKAGLVDKTRDHVLLGKERTDVGRPHDAGYPVRGIVKGNLIYTINYKPERWPSGNPETGYLDTDGGPTKTQILNAKRAGTDVEKWDLSFGKKGKEELYDIGNDIDAMKNLATDPEYAKTKAALRKQMEQELKAQQDPRMSGKGDIFDSYPFAEPASRNFYERFMKGEKMKAGWVNESDFEKEKK